MIKNEGKMSASNIVSIRCRQEIRCINGYKDKGVC